MPGGARLELCRSPVQVGGSAHVIGGDKRRGLAEVPLALRREPASLPGSVTQEEAEKDECNNDSSGQRLPGASTCRHLSILTALTTRVDCYLPNCPSSGKPIPETVGRASSQRWFGLGSDAARGSECGRRYLAVRKSMKDDTPKNLRKRPHLGPDASANRRGQIRGIWSSQYHVPCCRQLRSQTPTGSVARKAGRN